MSEREAYRGCDQSPSFRGPSGTPVPTPAGKLRSAPFGEGLRVVPGFQLQALAPPFQFELGAAHGGFMGTAQLADSRSPPGVKLARPGMSRTFRPAAGQVEAKASVEQRRSSLVDGLDLQWFGFICGPNR